MKERKLHSQKIVASLTILCIILSLVLSACSGLPFLGATPTTAPSPVQNSTPEAISTPVPQAEVSFIAQIPDGTPVKADVNINLLDEVTGLSFNASRYSMKLTDNRHYEVKLPVPVGSVIKYRYTREGTSPAIEYNSNGQQVRYRLAYISGPMLINDTISAWTDAAYQGASGQISGVILNSGDESAYPQHSG